MAPQVGLEPTTLRLTAALFGTLPACFQTHGRSVNAALGALSAPVAVKFAVKFFFSC